MAGAAVRAAVAVGSAFDGARLEVGSRVAVPHGEVVLGCRWPFGPTSLRGAVVAAVGPSAHVDLHNHLGDSTRQARATVCYRVRDGRPVVYAYGPRALDHLRAVARLGALTLPTGELVDVEEAQLTVATTEVGLHKEAWYRYELAAPYFPSTVAYGRRPRTPGPERVAWAGQCVASSIRMLLGDLGLEVWPHVQVVDYQQRQVRWRDRDEAVRSGFVARFVSNAILPDGIALGQHVAEGFGEVRCR